MKPIPIKSLDSYWAKKIIKFTIYGQLWSMKNAKIPTRSGIWIKNPKALAFEKSFIRQVTGNLKQNLSGKLLIVGAIWYPSMRQDVDGELICDCCQKAGIVSNDRDFWHKYFYRAGIDKNNPRIDIEICAIKNEKTEINALQ